MSCTLYNLENLICVQIIPHDNQTLVDDYFDEAAARDREEAAKPFIDFTVKNRTVTWVKVLKLWECSFESSGTIESRNIDRIEIRFYKTDIEMMFSHAPFPDQHDVAYTASPRLELEIIFGKYKLATLQNTFAKK